jgi:hypothetical protein
LLHNVISHGIARLAEFLDDELTYVIAGRSEPSTSRPRRTGPHELRVLIRDKSGTTAFFCFSTQIKPGLNQFESGALGIR